MAASTAAVAPRRRCCTGAEHSPPAAQRPHPGAHSAVWHRQPFPADDYQSTTRVDKQRRQSLLVAGHCERVCTRPPPRPGPWRPRARRLPRLAPGSGLPCRLPRPHPPGLLQRHSRLVRPVRLGRGPSLRRPASRRRPLDRRADRGTPAQDREARGRSDGSPATLLPGRPDLRRRPPPVSDAYGHREHRGVTTRSSTDTPRLDVLPQAAKSVGSTGTRLTCPAPTPAGRGAPGDHRSPQDGRGAGGRRGRRSGYSTRSMPGWGCSPRYSTHALLIHG